MNRAANRKDVQILRGLAKRYVEICHADENGETRDLWRRHNSLQPTRPLLLAMTRTHFEAAPESELHCEDEFLRMFERELRRRIYHAGVGDDTVFEPWIEHWATMVFPVGDWHWWGVPFNRVSLGDHKGWRVDPPIKELCDIEKVVGPPHRVHEEDTERGRRKLEDALGDILPVVIDRGPVLKFFPGDISTDLAYLRGLEQIMWDMTDNPAWLHRLLRILSEGTLKNHDECEAAGDFRLVNSYNQAMPYSLELPDPSPSGEPVARRKLWWFMASQEFALISPEMHEEFLLRYQIPVLEKFGLVAYGCCEDLTRKIDILRKIPNLRRIAVTPWADVARCAEQIGTDYVCSWRPSPARMVCNGFDADRVRKTTREALAEFRKHGCIVDITLKDVHTVEGEARRVREWARIVRECAEEYG